MKIIYTILGSLIALGISNANAALPKLNQSVTLVNESEETLVYHGFSNTNPETIFIVSPKTVMPGGIVTITALSNDYNFADLSGDIHFKDSFGEDHLFHVNDPQQIHVAKPALGMQEGKDLAHLANAHPQPFALTYNAVLS